MQAIVHYGCIYDMIFITFLTTKHKLYIVSESAPSPNENFWLRTCRSCTVKMCYKFGKKFSHFQTTSQFVKHVTTLNTHSASSTVSLMARKTQLSRMVVMTT